MEDQRRDRLLEVLLDISVLNSQKHQIYNKKLHYEEHSQMKYFFLLKDELIPYFLMQLHNLLNQIKYMGD